MKAFLFALLALAFGLSQIARAQEKPQTVPLHITAYDTHSGIMVTQFRFLRVKDTHHASASGNMVVIHSQGTATSACVSFVNMLPRAVTQVDFHFVFYDRLHNHAGDAELVRTGSFAPDTPIEADFSNVNGMEDTKDCVLLPFHDPPLALAVAFVKSATFADGSQWVTSGPAIAEHLDPN